MKTLYRLKCVEGTPAELLGAVFAECGFDYEVCGNLVVVYVPNELSDDFRGFLRFVERFYDFNFSLLEDKIKV